MNMNLKAISILLFLLLAACMKQESALEPVSSLGGDNVVSKPASDWIFADFLDEVEGLTDPVEQDALIDSFMTYAENHHGFPLTEDSLCHYLFRGAPQFPFSMAGDMNGWNPSTDYFTQIAGTDLYYLTHSYPVDARLDYKFVQNGNWILDPLNPLLIWGGFGPNSELRMPEYIYPSEIDYDSDITHGTVESHNFNSSILNNTRTVQVYLPSEYAMSTDDYRCIYVQDGGEYVSLGSMVNVLDNLISAGEMYPVVAVFIDPVNRNDEYWLNESYVDMVVQELLPFIEAEYRIKDDPAERAIMGASLGGLISLHAAYLYPDVFELAGSQSGAFWVNNEEIISLIAGSDPLGTTVYLDWGIFEESIMNTNYALLDVLEANNYTVTTGEFPEGHSWGSWRAHLDDLLKTFWETDPNGI